MSIQAVETAIGPRPTAEQRIITPGERAAATRARRGFVLALVCAAVAIVAIDGAIVNVALASIQHDLGVDHGTLQWVVVAYGLLLGGFLLLGGRMADQLGRRRVFLTGIAVFTGASLLAGLAQHAGLLIVARGVQGVGAALIVPAALSLLAVTFAEGPERDRAVGLFGAVDGVAASAGVVVGGLLAAGLGWRWAFLIHVPVGMVLLVAALVFLSADRPDERAPRLDVAGAITVTGGLLVFVYALHHAASHGWFTWSALALFTAAAALLAVFLRIEARAAAPLVPAAMLRNRTRAAANLTAFLAFSALLSFIFIGSLLMQQVLGYSPAVAGVAWLATTATIFVAAMTGTRFVARVGGRRLLITGLSLVALGAFWLSRVPADAGYATDLLPAFLFAGVGFGFCGPALQLGALSGVSRSDAGLASGLVETSREIGGGRGRRGVDGAPHGLRPRRLPRRLHGRRRPRRPRRGRRDRRIRTGHRAGRRDVMNGQSCCGGSEHVSSSGTGGEAACAPPVPAVVDRSVFQAELDRLRRREKAHTREGDAIAAARRRLPVVDVDPGLELIGPNGPLTLLDAFEGRRQLIAYYFMWWPGRPAPEQCEGCALFLGQVAELSSLHSRDITYAVFSQGRNTAFGPGDVQVSYDESLRYGDFKGWDMPWYSAQPSLDALLVGRESGLMHLVCYLRDGDRVFETYWTNRRGVEAMDYGYSLMDLTVYGRQEPWEDSPAGWPQQCSMRTDGGPPTWPPVSEEWGGRPIAQWSRVEAGHSDDLTAGRP